MRDGLTEAGSQAVAAILFLVGLYFAYLFHLQKRSLADALVANSAGRALRPMVVCRLGLRLDLR